MISRLKRKLKKIWKEDIVKREIVINYVPVMYSKLLLKKIVLIIGATGKVGESIVETFVDVGATVIVAGRNKDKLLNIEKKYGVRSILFDLNDINEYYSKIVEAGNYYGRIDILVNASGGQTQKDVKQLFFEFTEADFDYDINTNLKSEFFLVQAMSKYMIEQKIRGSIVTVISEMGYRAAKTPYDISRWGARGFIQGVALMLADYGIVVNGVAPGIISTEMGDYKEGDSLYLKAHPNKRYVTPKEIANTCLFLASDFGNNMVGEIIISDGGSHLK